MGRFGTIQQCGHLLTTLSNLVFTRGTFHSFILCVFLRYFQFHIDHIQLLAPFKFTHMYVCYWYLGQRRPRQICTHISFQLSCHIPKWCAERYIKTKNVSYVSWLNGNLTSRFLITLKRFGRLAPLVKRTKEELYIWYHDLSHSMFVSLMIWLNSKVGLYKDDCLRRVNPLLWKRQGCFWPGALVSMKRWNMLNVRQLDIWWLVAQPEVKIYFQCWCNNMFLIRSQLHTDEKIALLVFQINLREGRGSVKS